MKKMPIEIEDKDIFDAEVIRFSLTMPSNPFLLFTIDGNLSYRRVMSIERLTQIFTDDKFAWVRRQFIEKLVNPATLANDKVANEKFDGFPKDLLMKAFGRLAIKDERVPKPRTHKMRVQANPNEVPNAILDATTIKFMSTTGGHHKLIYFEFDGEEYYMDAKELQIILASSNFSEVANAFIDKLTNIDKFVNDSSIRRFLPEFTADADAEIY